MKETLASRYGDIVRPFLADGSSTLSRADAKTAVKTIHSNAVLKIKEELGPNPVLGVLPRPIDSSERSLPRRQRCVFAQLRSGLSSHLRSYSHRIGKTEDAICPECRIRRQTTRQLFECEACPTSLSVEDL